MDVGETKAEDGAVATIQRLETEKAQLAHQVKEMESRIDQLRYDLSVEGQERRKADARIDTLLETIKNLSTRR